jgi:N-terminal domain of anti-restriction factor ArdC
VAITTRRRLSDQERDERRAEDRERLKQAAEQLLTSEGWQRWVRVRARGGLARLSLNNQLLVALAMPDATFVAGFKAWLALGYCVRKGETAIRIIAPMPIKDRDDDRSSDEQTQTRLLFKAVSVFDRSQVAPLEGVEPTPLGPPSEPLTGDSHAYLLAPMQAFTASLGFTVSFESIPGQTGGWCDQRARRIVVDKAQPANARLRILIHETIHALGVGYAEYGRERAEVIVDTATYVAAASVGLDVSGESIAYVAGWGEDGALEAVTAFATTIDELARKVETALTQATAPALAA